MITTPRQRLNSILDRWGKVWNPLSIWDHKVWDQRRHFPITGFRYQQIQSTCLSYLGNTRWSHLTNLRTFLKIQQAWRSCLLESSEMYSETMKLEIGTSGSASKNLGRLSRSLNPRGKKNQKKNWKVEDLLGLTIQDGERWRKLQTTWITRGW